MSRGEFKVNVETVTDEKGRIVQTVYAVVSPEKMDAVQRTVMDTAEAQTRKALMQMGWRPPAEKVRR